MPDWLPWAALAAVFAALTAVMSAAGVRDMDPDVAVLVRTAVVLAAVAAVVATAGKWRAAGGWDRTAVCWLVLSGLTTAASWLCYLRALKAGPVSQVAPFEKLSVALAPVLAVAVLGERPSAAGWVGIGLVAAGAAVLAAAR